MVEWALVVVGEVCDRGTAADATEAVRLARAATRARSYVRAALRYGLEVGVRIAPHAAPAAGPAGQSE
jgi:hypothetical protein